MDYGLSIIKKLVINTFLIVIMISTDIRLGHRIIRTLSVVEQLDLEISGTQLQLLLPFKNIPSKNNLYNEILCYVVS